MRLCQQKTRAMKRPRAENLQNIPVVATPVEAKDSPSSIFLLPSVIIIQGCEKSYFQPAREP